MSVFVIDSSVVMSWAFEDECSDYADMVLESLVKNQAMAPGVLILEVVNVLLAAERQNRIKPKESEKFIELLEGMPIEVKPFLPEKESILVLGRNTGLSAYDASYARLANQEHYPLATLDEKLKKAAQSIGIKIWCD